MHSLVTGSEEADVGNPEIYSRGWSASWRSTRLGRKGPGMLGLRKKSGGGAVGRSGGGAGAGSFGLV